MNIQQRLSKITSVTDLDEQLELARKETLSKKRDSKCQEITLAEKIERHRLFKAACEVYDLLRLNYFVIEDAIFELQQNNHNGINVEVLSPMTLKIKLPIQALT